jgi:YbbR domain-containing protein
MKNVFRWLTSNLGVLLLALLLAVVVWASAVISADPNLVDTSDPVPLQLVNQDTDLLMINEPPESVQVSLQAPTSIWDEINDDPDSLRAWIDLTGLGPGSYTLPVNVQTSLSPVRILEIFPEEVEVVLEPLLSEQFAVEPIIVGTPPLGYKAGTLEISPEEITISGPASAVSQVSSVSAGLDITGITETITRTVPIQVRDARGELVVGIDVTPRTVTLTQPVSLLGGYKNLVVRVLTTGQVASGYRLTNVSVTPPNVTVFSNDPAQIIALPGYVETLPVDLTGLNDDIEVSVSLNLPEGVSLVSEPSVLVQIGVAAIEGSLTLTMPVEPLGLPPSLAAIISPPTVDIIVVGPLPVLDTLTPASFRVIVDLTDLEEGLHLVSPIVDLVPDQVSIQSIVPETVLVNILPVSSLTPTPTFALLPAPATPTPTRTVNP